MRNECWCFLEPKLLHVLRVFPLEEVSAPSFGRNSLFLPKDQLNGRIYWRKDIQQCSVLTHCCFGGKGRDAKTRQDTYRQLLQKISWPSAEKASLVVSVSCLVLLRIKSLGTKKKSHAWCCLMFLVLFRLPGAVWRSLCCSTFLLFGIPCAV